MNNRLDHYEGELAAIGSMVCDLLEEFNEDKELPFTMMDREKDEFKKQLLKVTKDVEKAIKTLKAV